MTFRQVLVAPDERIATLFFPEVGIASITFEGVEVGVVGREGLVGGTVVLLGSDTSPYSHVVQVPGAMLTIDTEALRGAIAASPSLGRMFLHFVRAYVIQTSHTAYANASYGIEARLARWLLMCHDRVDGDEIRITHEYLGQMLGMHRTGVTMALQSLQANGLVRAQRGGVVILRHAGLVALAGDSYGVPEASYARLLGNA
ncbi:Crp/Fnr family transcriptional regulator [Methylobacterium sp. J-092]|uniref:Crp/Fnr family transcriptional regulator n=1 Tax=Methylobacterium sp. J-092 TaxID=2836667 RepID=UPI0028C44BB7|nr:Crp/Fnr family transcriptional regulator [Methylobacterium sp. J-092]